MSDRRPLQDLLPAVLIFGLVWYGSSIPAAQMPDSGLLDFDKLLHFGEYSVVAFGLLWALRRRPLIGGIGCRLAQVLAIGLACLALVDLVDASPPHPRGPELVDFADDAPSSHCYVHMNRFVAHAYRILRPGGFLLFADFRPSATVDALAALDTVDEVVSVMRVEGL